MKLGQLLEQTQPDVKVVYTRTSDTYPALYERAALANKVHADLFISIHCNSMPYHRVLVGHRYVKRNGKRYRVPIYKMIRSSSETGTETYVLGLHRMGQKTQAIESEMEADSNDVEARENAYIVHEKIISKITVDSIPASLKPIFCWPCIHQLICRKVLLLPIV